jgi:glycosyltransferase involved in cell wall biosynthesis
MNAPRKHRLLIVSDYFFPHWTGIVKGIFSMAKGLANELDISVITVRYKDTLPIEEVIDGVRIVRTPYMVQLSRACYSPQLVARFVTEARAADTVLINCPCSNILPCGVLTKLLGKRLVVFHQGDLILPEGAANRAIESIFNVCTWVAMRLADKVSTYTPDYANNSRVLKPFLDKFEPLLMPVVFPEVPEGVPDRLAVLPRLRDEGKILFGFGGRFVAEKGFDILFNAMPRILDRLPSARFVFAGETNIFYEKFFETQAHHLERFKENVELLGLLDERELVRYYDLVDFIVIPSRSDCFSIFQAEACLRGKPSIVADIPGARWLVRETGFGVVFDTESPEALASAVIEAVERRDELLRNYDKVKTLLDPERALGAFKRALEA